MWLIRRSAGRADSRRPQVLFGQRSTPDLAKGRNEWEGHMLRCEQHLDNATGPLSEIVLSGESRDDVPALRIGHTLVRQGLMDRPCRLSPRRASAEAPFRRQGPRDEPESGSLLPASRGTRDDAEHRQSLTVPYPEAGTREYISVMVALRVMPKPAPNTAAPTTTAAGTPVRATTRMPSAEATSPIGEPAGCGHGGRLHEQSRGDHAGIARRHDQWQKGDDDPRARCRHREHGRGAAERAGTGPGEQGQCRITGTRMRWPVS